MFSVVMLSAMACTIANSSRKWEELFCNSYNFIKVNWHSAYFTLGISASRHFSSCNWHFYWPSAPALMILRDLLHSSMFGYNCWEICSKHMVDMQRNTHLCLSDLRAGISTGCGSSPFGEMFLFPQTPWTLQDSEYKLWKNRIWLGVFF